MPYEIHSPVWSSENTIDVVIVHPRLGSVPYTCADNSGEPEMQEIWDAILRGDFGPIGGRE